MSSGKSLTQKVIEYIKFHPGAKPADIADYLGISPKLVRAILSRLRARGIIVRTEKGYFLRPGAEASEKGLTQGLLEEEKVSEEIESGKQLAETIISPATSAAAKPHEEGKSRAQQASLTSATPVSSHDVEAVKKSIEELRSRTQNIEDTQSKIVKKVEELESRIQGAESRFEEMTKRLAEVGSRIEKLENAINQITNELSAVKAQSMQVREVKPGDEDYTSLGYCTKLVVEALDVVKMSLESIRIGDAHSLESLTQELEDLVSRIRKCLKLKE
ncbi:MAG: winged helix-turn-helix transcriptional regulator [Ignisphaera sp.]|nr:winged helix-turn-helix transcriptional regulator [Ignisphaera sp.]